MNEQAIKKLRRKFTLSAFLSFLAVMLMMGTLILCLNLQTNVRQWKKVLTHVAENGGYITGIEHERDGDSPDALSDFLEDVFGVALDSSPEFRYSTRYFAVLFSENGKAEETITNNIAAVSPEQALEYGEAVVNRGPFFGYYGNYVYQVADTDEGRMVVFLDASVQNRMTKRLISIISLLILMGALGMFLLVRLLSKRMIQPEIKNAELQKQFITNAGHELKTPLAVIRANTELDMMINGENEWNQSTLRQTENMTKLIQELIQIARADEAGKQDDLKETDVSAVVREAAEAFASVAQQSGKNMEEHIEEGITMQAVDGHVKQLATLLIDNAIKYCDDKGTVKTELSQKGKTIRLTVSNDYREGENVDYTRFFERFYRADESHNSEKGGYGIGLSIAESLVKRYKGTIKADWSSGRIRFTCTLKNGKA